MQNTNKIITGIILSMVSTFLIAVTPASAASGIPCSSAVNFNPYIVEYMRGGDEKQMIVPFTQTMGEKTPECVMTIQMFDTEGAPVQQSKVEHVVQINDSQLTIDTQKMEKTLEDGTYTLKFKKPQGDLIEGVLALDIKSGAVLGAYNERVGASDSIKFINVLFYAALFAGAFYFYKTKHSSRLNNK